MLNSASEAQIHFIGDEKTPVMFFDDFALNTPQLIEYACNNDDLDKLAILTIRVFAHLCRENMSLLYCKAFIS